MVQTVFAADLARKMTFILNRFGRTTVISSPQPEAGNTNWGRLGRLENPSLMLLGTNGSFSFRFHFFGFHDDPLRNYYVRNPFKINR